MKNILLHFFLFHHGEMEKVLSGVIIGSNMISVSNQSSLLEIRVCEKDNVGTFLHRCIRCHGKLFQIQFRSCFFSMNSFGRFRLHISTLRLKQYVILIIHLRNMQKYDMNEKKKGVISEQNSIQLNPDINLQGEINYF